MTIIPEEGEGRKKKEKKIELILAVRTFNFIVKMFPCSLNAVPVALCSQVSSEDKTEDGEYGRVSDHIHNP
jgi:hypothetical protein